MKWQIIERALIFLAAILFLLSILYIVYWKAAILFNLK